MLLYEAIAKKAFLRAFAQFRTETDQTRLHRVLMQGFSKMLLRHAIGERVPIPWVLRMALMLFKDHEDVLRDFIRDFGVALDRRKKGLARCERSNKILMVWDGFNILRGLQPRVRRIFSYFAAPVSLEWPGCLAADEDDWSRARTGLSNLSEMRQPFARAAGEANPRGKVR